MVEIKMTFLFHDEDVWTWYCLRTLRKAATVRHQKHIHDVLRIDRELRMCKFFSDHAVPFMCSEDSQIAEVSQGIDVCAAGCYCLHAAPRQRAV